MEDVRTDSYRVLLKGGAGEYVEKKSRFIATLAPCRSEEEALRFIGDVKKKYWDARHNCHAFIIGDGGELTRCSDDGEPSGTAGRPMLEVLAGEELRNAAAVVTRYFGGVLLGTGGLVRAYTRAVQEGLKSCSVGRMRYGHEVTVTADYNEIGKVLYLLKSEELEPLSADYGENAVLRLNVSAERFAVLRKSLTDVTGGRIKFEKTKDTYFVDKEDGRG